MAAALVTSVALRAAGSTVKALDAATPEGFALNLIVTTAVTTAVWLAVTFATRPEPAETLEAFYRKVRPAGGGWGPIARTTGIAPPAGEIARNFGFWVLGIVLVYSVMFSTGGVIFHLHRQAIGFGALALVSGALLVRGLAREKKLDGMTA